MKKLTLLLFVTISLRASQMAQPEKPTIKLIIDNKEQVLRYGAVVPAENMVNKEGFRPRALLAFVKLTAHLLDKKSPIKSCGLTHFYFDSNNIIIEGEPNVKYANQALISSDVDEYDADEFDVDEGTALSAEKPGFSKYVPLELSGLKIADLIKEVNGNAKKSAEDEKAKAEKEMEDAQENPYLTIDIKGGAYRVHARPFEKENSGIIVLSVRQKVRIKNYVDDLKLKDGIIKLRFSDVPAPK